MKDHVILNYLDEPYKFFKWPVTTVLTVIAPGALLLLLGKPVLGVVGSVGSALAIGSYQRRFGKGSFLGLSYWILPHRPKLMPMTPPSHIRTYIG